MNVAKCLRTPFFTEQLLENTSVNLMLLNNTNHSSCNLANVCLLKINKRNTRKRCKICSKLTIKTPEQHQRRHFDVFKVAKQLY